MDASQGSCEGQLPLRFILPTESSFSSSSQRLYSSEDSEVLLGLSKLQSVEINRERVKACFRLWASGLACRDAQCDTEPQFHYRRHRPRMISQHSDLPAEILTEASTPCVCDFASKDRAKVSVDTGTQTDPGLCFCPIKSDELLALRSKFFPSVSPKERFWTEVLSAEISAKSLLLQQYEDSLLRANWSFVIPRLEDSEAFLQLLQRAKEAASRQEEQLAARRAELEDVFNSLRTQKQVAELEKKVQQLTFPGPEDYRLQYAHLLLDRQALELERRLLELRQEELVTQREFLCLPSRPAPLDRSRPISAVVQKWAMYSLRTQPISLQLVPIALLLLQAQCRLAKCEKSGRTKRGALGKALRTCRMRERLTLKEYLRLLYFRSVEKRVLDFQRSGYSPSVSYTSIGDECSVRSPHGLFALKSMELIQDSNRSAALNRLEAIARKWREKKIERKANSWRQWRVYSLGVEVQYYRTLLPSVDGMLQALRKNDQSFLAETRRSQARIARKLTEVQALTSQFLH